MRPVVLLEAIAALLVHFDLAVEASTAAWSSRLRDFCRRAHCIAVSSCVIDYEAKMLLVVSRSHLRTQTFDLIVEVQSS